MVDLMAERPQHAFKVAELHSARCTCLGLPIVDTLLYLLDRIVLQSDVSISYDSSLLEVSTRACCFVLSTKCRPYLM